MKHPWIQVIYLLTGSLPAFYVPWIDVRTLNTAALLVTVQFLRGERVASVPPPPRKGGPRMRDRRHRIDEGHQRLRTYRHQSPFPVYDCCLNVRVGGTERNGTRGFQGRTAPERPLKGSDARLARFREVLGEKLETGVVSMLVGGAVAKVRGLARLSLSAGDARAGVWGGGKGEYSRRVYFLLRFHDPYCFFFFSFSPFAPFPLPSFLLWYP